MKNSPTMHKYVYFSSFSDLLRTRKSAKSENRGEVRRSNEEENPKRRNMRRKGIWEEIRERKIIGFVLWSCCVSVFNEKVLKYIEEFSNHEQICVKYVSCYWTHDQEIRHYWQNLIRHLKKRGNISRFQSCWVCGIAPFLLSIRKCWTTLKKWKHLWYWSHSLIFWEKMLFEKGEVSWLESMNCPCFVRYPVLFLFFSLNFSLKPEQFKQSSKQSKFGQARKPQTKSTTASQADQISKANQLNQAHSALPLCDMLKI